jgi:raffinose/stachyose/melibiose transport system permease protein
MSTMAETVMTESTQRASPIGTVMRYAVCIIMSIFVLVPILTAVTGGFKERGQLMAHPFAIPNPVRFGNYSDILQMGTFWRQLSNSLLVTASTTLLVLGVGSSAAFVFARMQFRGRDWIATYFIFGLLFPTTIAILPLYILIRRLGLIDSLWGIILPQVAFQLPIAILILRTFFTSIPKEIEDAAYVDGASPFEFFTRILLPLAKPGLSAVAVLTMVVSWNNYFLPLVVLNSSQKYTLPLGVMQFTGQYGADWSMILAFITLAMVPAVAFYLIAERQIITGLTTGAVKG